MNKKVLIIDNYDSFTYNLAHLLYDLKVGYEVWRNDQYALDDVQAFEHILISSGGGQPEEAGNLMATLERYADHKKMLGIGLGMHALAKTFGASLSPLPEPLHGIASGIQLTDPTEALFQDFPENAKVARYHSWQVDASDFPIALKITAEDENGVILGISHKELSIKGLQFSPGSVLTENGSILVKNWLSL